MDIEGILAELRRELAAIELAIVSLERLRAGSRRRGRPPRWLTLVQNEMAPHPKLSEINAQDGKMDRHERGGKRDTDHAV